MSKFIFVHKSGIKYHFWGLLTPRWLNAPTV